ncbi:DUF397 domain-containing protein [Streptomyces sp. NBC_01728]|uniref:DUF397 domain-containing protein n=1 Tax=unclassified Streptomyces TaxID=2593676 RepID=UPI0022576004|nr:MULTISPECIES: DUF397 domain-containing protein [unclassified Streptomyces]MCX4455108.1 DUF397 domain-containing protein [Streptomyces sp. NBC_01719]MCX4494468.1 DUF397 domain-containing protein [Streptomyces sp. NBC_01728]
MLPHPDPTTVAWRKSSYSEGGDNNCVEVADGYPGLVPVRDSKAPQGPALVLSAGAWAPFEGAVKNVDAFGGVSFE